MVCSPERTSLVFAALENDPTARSEGLLGGGAPSPSAAPFGVYLHVPFCAHICPYCDFNTYAGQSHLIPRYVDALQRDIMRQGQNVDGREAATIFFGGGTPSLLPASDVARLVDACRASFNVVADAEITLEANPNGVDEAYFDALLDAGINRLSIGAQTLHHRGLRALGRLHEANDTARAVIAARSAGFTNISLDLIFGWPGQTLADWETDLTAVLRGHLGGTAPDHLSLYNLIVEPGTPLHDAVSRGILSVPDDDAGADLYETAISHLAAAGYTHYEVANWARDSSHVSRHNLVYWRNGEYVGVGAGAHGHLSSHRTMNHLLPTTYCQAIEGGENPVSNSEDIPPTTAMAETMMLGLRLLEEGISAGAFDRRHGHTLDEVYGPTIDQLVAQDLMIRSGDRLRLTPRGLMLANDVCARFV